MASIACKDCNTTESTCIPMRGYGWLCGSCALVRLQDEMAESQEFGRTLITANN